MRCPVLRSSLLLLAELIHKCGDGGGTGAEGKGSISSQAFLSTDFSLSSCSLRKVKAATKLSVHICVCLVILLSETIMVKWKNIIYLKYMNYCSVASFYSYYTLGINY